MQSIGGRSQSEIAFATAEQGRSRGEAGHADVIFYRISACPFF
ncbi:MAG: hypothetical protein ABIJ41_07105 [Candidatus Omnitrophota bacterium]